MQTDERVLRRALTQLLVADLTRSHGWREGVSFHLGLPRMESDMTAGERLVDRGVMRRSATGSLQLSESAVVRALHVAVDAAVADLLEHYPPPATFAEELDDPDEEAEDDETLVLGGASGDEPFVRHF